MLDSWFEDRTASTRLRLSRLSTCHNCRDSAAPISLGLLTNYKLFRLPTYATKWKKTTETQAGEIERKMQRQRCGCNWLKTMTQGDSLKIFHNFRAARRQLKPKPKPKWRWLWAMSATAAAAAVTGNLQLAAAAARLNFNIIKCKYANPCRRLARG